MRKGMMRIPALSIFRAVSHAGLTIIASEARVEARSRSGSDAGTCFGILHRDQAGLHFGGSQGEDEGICVVGKSDEERVLAVCTIGHYCEIKGATHECKDSGECAEISDIKSVKKSK
jgi:hypothetical protein